MLSAPNETTPAPNMAMTAPSNNATVPLNLSNMPTNVETDTDAEVTFLHEMATAPSMAATSPSNTATAPLNLATVPTNKVIDAAVTTPNEMVTAPSNIATAHSNLATEPTKVVTDPDAMANLVRDLNHRIQILEGTWNFTKLNTLKVIMGGSTWVRQGLSWAISGQLGSIENKSEASWGPLGICQGPFGQSGVHQGLLGVF